MGSARSPNGTRSTSGFKRRRESAFVPDRNDEYFLYQTLIGSWPMQNGAEPSAAGTPPEYRARLKEYLVKAVREAKVHTVWLKPDREYEEGFLDYLDHLLDSGTANAFLAFLPSFPAQDRLVRHVERVVADPAENRLSGHTGLLPGR